MGDVCDESDSDIEMTRNAGIAAVRRAASLIPRGRKGECKRCGETSLRLVTGICAPCRDRELIRYWQRRN